MNLDIMAFTVYLKKRWTDVINLDDKNSKWTHWVSWFTDRNTAVYFDSFEIEYIIQEVLNKIRDKSIILKYAQNTR